VAPSPARPSIAAVDAQRETSTHMTAGGSPVRWAREDGISSNEVRTIYFVLWGGSEADVALVTAMNHGLRVWNDASPYLDLRLAAGECPEGRHCVLVGQADLNGAVTHVSPDAEGRMSGHGATIIFDGAPWDPDLLDNAACHEVGHALGLNHAPAEHVAGPCWQGRPTLHDRALVAEAYAWN